MEIEAISVEVVEEEEEKEKEVTERRKALVSQLQG